MAKKTAPLQEKKAQCHICGGELTPKLDMGRLPLANAFVSDVKAKETFYDGVWSWCPECQLLQLANPPKSSEMFTENYPYKTSTSQAMIKHFEEVATELCNRYDPVTVGEIGCSDGGMIQFLKGCARVGFEPSKACWKALGEKEIDYYPSFTIPNVRDAIEMLDSKFDLLYSANTLRSIPELSDLLCIAKEALHPVWGCLVIEEPHLLPILASGEFDQFYDENVFCFTVTAMAKIAERYGLRLYDAEKVSTHGGSVRYHLCQVGNEEHVDITDTVWAMMVQENGIFEKLDEFNVKAEETGIALVDTLIDLKSEGKRVVGVGATAKSCVVLAGNGIAENLVRVVYDNTPSKAGKFTPASHIPILEESKIANEPDDTVFLLFAWNHQQEVIQKIDPEKKHRWLTYVPNVYFI